MDMTLWHQCLDSSSRNNILDLDFKIFLSIDCFNKVKYSRFVEVKAKYVAFLIELIKSFCDWTDRKQKMQQTLFLAVSCQQWKVFVVEDWLLWHQSSFSHGPFNTLELCPDFSSPRLAAPDKWRQLFQNFYFRNNYILTMRAATIVIWKPFVVKLWWSKKVW